MYLKDGMRVFHKRHERGDSILCTVHPYSGMSSACVLCSVDNGEHISTTYRDASSRIGFKATITMAGASNKEELREFINNY